MARITDTRGSSPLGSMQPWFPKDRSDSRARGQVRGTRSRHSTDRPSENVDWDGIIARFKKWCQENYPPEELYDGEVDWRP